MPKAYVLLTEAIHDPEGMEAYGRASGPSLVEHKGSPLVVDEDVEVLEGSWHGNRTVLVEFESIEAARRWYSSPSYQQAKPRREAASECNVVLLTGFELRRG